MKPPTILTHSGLEICIFLVIATGLSVSAVSQEYPTGGHAYEVVYAETPMIWLDARDSALDLGGYLAVISDQEEQDAVAALLTEPERAWIGGADAVVESQWRWYTGEDWEFAMWDIAQPDTVFGMDFLQIEGATGGWHAASGTTGAFVVEYECCGNLTGNVNCSSDGKLFTSPKTSFVARKAAMLTVQVTKT